MTKLNEETRAQLKAFADSRDSSGSAAHVEGLDEAPSEFFRVGSSGSSQEAYKGPLPDTQEARRLKNEADRIISQAQGRERVDELLEEMGLADAPHPSMPKYHIKKDKVEGHDLGPAAQKILEERHIRMTTDARMREAIPDPHILPDHAHETIVSQSLLDDDPIEVRISGFDESDEPVEGVVRVPGSTKHNYTRAQGKMEVFKHMYGGNVDAVLDVRGNDYGEAWKLGGYVMRFIEEHVSGSLVVTMGKYVYAWTMILNKLIRALANPKYLDNWTDIAGYAQLVIDDLNIEGEIDV